MCGTTHAYNRGCRCQDCRAAKTAAQRKWRHAGRDCFVPCLVCDARFASRRDVYDHEVKAHR